MGKDRSGRGQKWARTEMGEDRSGRYIWHKDRSGYGPKWVDTEVGIPPANTALKVFKYCFKY